MSQRVADATTDAVPVRQVADVILSFGLELPTVPGPRRAPRRSSGAHRLADAPVRHMGSDAGAESGASRTVAVAPEVLAKARRLAFGPPLPPVPAQRGSAPTSDDVWAPTASPTTASPTSASPTTAVPAPRRHRDDVAPHTTVLPLQTRGPVDDDPWAPQAANGATRFVTGLDRSDEPETDPSGFAATTIHAAATTVHRPVRDDDTALVTQDEPESEPYPDIDRPITSGKTNALGNARRSRSTRQLAVVTASMASVAIVGAAAAAVVSLSNGSPAPADNASSDLDLAHQAALPEPADTPQAQTSTQAPPTTQSTTGATDRNGTTAAAQGSNGTAGENGTSTRATTTTTRAPAAARAVPVVNASGKSAAAAQVALQQIGKPYEWGSTGPSSFDCSGLVYYAFQQMGVTLPRTAAAMAQVGTPVSKSELKIGDGKVVNATTDGEPVQVSPLSDFPMTSARRV
ncbi:MAG: hypothetical protein ABS81_27030 [Pseudonocardia sp. SCN 72-86]|nr:MAG: hypothetical protein ABS81_27030 [Pseudonocardia sp. SCN 72-86]